MSDVIHRGNINLNTSINHYGQ